MSKPTRSALVISDIHAGSPYAICDDEGIPIPFGNDVNWVRPNKGQLELYDYWNEMIDTADEFSVDTVINLADAMDGVDYYNSGQGVMTPVLDSQVDLAEKLLKPVVRNRKYVSCSGSPYHQSRDTSLHLKLSDKLDSSASETLFVGSAGLLTLKEFDKRLLIAHKASNAMLYTATMMDRELTYQKVAEANGQLPEIHYRLTGHLHKAMHLDNGYQHYLQAPCWKSWYPIKGSTKLIGRMQTDVGWSIITWDDKGRSNVDMFVKKSPNIAIRESVI